LPAAPPLDLGPGRFGLRPERDPLFGSLRLLPRGKDPPDDFPSLEPAVTSWFLGSQVGCCLAWDVDLDVMVDLLSGGEWEKGGSSVGHREDQSSRGRCDLCLQRRHFQKAAMILVRKKSIDFYFKSIIRLLCAV